MTTHVPINDEKGLIREINSKAVLSTNSLELQAYKARIRERDRVQYCMDSIDELKSEFRDIKEMLSAILINTKPK